MRSRKDMPGYARIDGVTLTKDQLGRIFPRGWDKFEEVPESEYKRGMG